MITMTKIHSYELGLYFFEGEIQKLLPKGTHWFFDPWCKMNIVKVSQRNPWLVHENLDLIVKSGLLEGHAKVVDLKDYQRALVWIDGRFNGVLPPGLYAYFDGFKDVRVEIVDARKLRFTHADFQAVVASNGATRLLDVCSVERNHVGVSFVDGEFVETLPPGKYAWWRGIAEAKLVEIDMREQALDVAGQEIMTADKVTLRMNALVNFRISDPEKAVMVAGGVNQTLYREAQLALRAVVGTRELDSFLTDKDDVTNEFTEQVNRRADELGVEVIAVGVRDIILPGDMKELMNKVTEAKKAAEANLIVRREETAAMRSQANTAKLLANNPTLMRLRELEVLEKIAASGKLNVVLGEKGLADRVTNLL